MKGSEQVHVLQAKQLHLPDMGGPVIPNLYIKMHGTGVPVVKADAEGRAGKVAGLPARSLEVKLGCVFR
jgi:hypothetical protein